MPSRRRGALGQVTKEREMFYDKNYVCARPVRRKLVLSRFKGFDPRQKSAGLPCDHAESAHGFAFEDGCLIAGPGVRPFKGIKPDLAQVTPPQLPYPQQDCKLGVYNNDDAEGGLHSIVVMFEDGAALLPVGDFAEWEEVFYMLFDRFDEGVNILDPQGKPVYVMVSRGAGVMCSYTGDSFARITSSTKTVTTICKHAERIFAVMSDDESTLLYSDAFDIYNWDVSLDGGGYITFDRDLGKIRRLVSFADYLFVFCDYGIYRVNARGDQLSFSVKRLYTACSRIFPETIAEAGDRLIFTAGDGIYFFDGYDVTRADVRLNEYLDVSAQGMCAAYCKHKYYLAFRICEGSWTAGDNNALAVLDVQTRELSLSRGIAVYDMKTLATASQNVVLGVLKGGSVLTEIAPSLGSCMGVPLEKEWRVSGIDMGAPADLKVVQSAKCNSQTPFVLGFVNERGKCVEAQFSAGECSRRLGIRGKNFTVYIKTEEEEVLIRPVELTVDFFEGESE